MEMENTTFKINRENKNIEMVMSVQIPFCNKQKAGSDFDVDRVRTHAKAFSFDLLGSFSKRLIASLERRMQACQKNLLAHICDIEYADECGHIVYVRKDGTRGTFNMPSFKSMQLAILALKQSRWGDFMSNPIWVDQTLKALLNDPEQDHSDEGKFKYSEIVSLLCEVHTIAMQ